MHQHNQSYNNLTFQNVVVSQEFEDLKDKINEARTQRHLTVIHGGVYFGQKISKDQEYDPVLEYENDPMTKLKNYAAKAKLRLVDLFRFFDRDQSWSLDKEEFIQGVKVSREMTKLSRDPKTYKTLVKKACTYCLQLVLCPFMFDSFFFNVIGVCSGWVVVVVTRTDIALTFMNNVYYI